MGAELDNTQQFRYKRQENMAQKFTDNENKFTDNENNENARTEDTDVYMGCGCVLFLASGFIMGIVSTCAYVLRNYGILTAEQAQNTISGSFCLIVCGIGAVLALAVLCFLFVFIRKHYKIIIFLILLALIIFAVSAVYSVL